VTGCGDEVARRNLHGTTVDRVAGLDPGGEPAVEH
jgi:hypothetical protein